MHRGPRTGREVTTIEPAEEGVNQWQYGSSAWWGYLLFALSVRGRRTGTGPTPGGSGPRTGREYVEIDPKDRANRDFLLVVQEVSPNIVRSAARTAGSRSIL